MTFTTIVTRALLPGLAFLAATAASAAAAPAEVYGVKEDKLDSRLGYYTVISDIPVDKSYAEMTDAQRTTFRARYNGMGPEYEPPFPVDGQQKIFQEMGKLQAAARLKGRFAAMVNVDETGHAHSIKIAATPDPQVNQPIAVVLMKNTEYKPATCSGKPCAMDFVFDITFDVPANESPGRTVKIRR